MLQNNKLFKNIGIRFSISLIILSILTIFIFDYFTPLGVAVGILYIIPILLTVNLSNKTSLLISIITTIFIVLGYYYSATGKVAGQAELNRIFSVCGLWISYSLISIKQKLDYKLIQHSILLKLTRDIAIKANETPDNDTVLKSTLNSICDALNWPIGNIYRVNKGDLLIPSNIWNNFDESKFSEFVEITNKTNFKFGEGLPGRVLKTKKPAWVIDVNNDGNFTRNNKTMSLLEVKAGFAFPILISNQVYAVAEFFYDVAKQPHQEVLNTMEQIGTQLGVVITRNEISEKIKKSLHEKDLLLREVHHRVKNNLQIISALLSLKETDNPEVKAFVKESNMRIRSMSLLHENIYQLDTLDKFNFKDYVISLLSYLFESYGIMTSKTTYKINVEDYIDLRLKDAICLGLIITEIVTNSLKYAFVDRDKGEISISITDGDDLVHIMVRDNGVGINLKETKTNSTGSLIIKSLAKQLGGNIDVENDNGTVYSLVYKNKKA